jgi:hypothetical protein
MSRSSPGPSLVKTGPVPGSGGDALTARGVGGDLHEAGTGTHASGQAATLG